MGALPTQSVLAKILNRLQQLLVFHWINKTEKDQEQQLERHSILVYQSKFYETPNRMPFLSPKKECN